MRYYSSVAGAMALTSDVTSSGTSITVDATTGLPAGFPYTLALDYGTATEELVDVTGASGNTLNVTRAVDGSFAQTHSAGAVVRHVFTARDLRESRAHEGAVTAHGVAGEIVGTTDTQTLTGKTIDGTANALQNIGFTSFKDQPRAAYVPAWTASGTAPSLGDGSLTGRAAKMGKEVVGEILLAPGATTTYGSGSYFLSLPYPAVGGSGAVVGTALLSDGSNYYPGVAQALTSTTVGVLISSAPTAVRWSATAPFTFADPSFARISFQYEAA